MREPLNAFERAGLLRAGNHGPHARSLSRGSPTFVALSFAASASATTSASPTGTKMRRMAVHFCPALTVISRTTSLMNASKPGVPGAAAGASSAAFTLSASIFTGSSRAPGHCGARVYGLLYRMNR